MNRGLLIAVSGFSGAGKGTIMKELVRRYSNYALSVSATTRPPRIGEEDGREYHFKTEEEFVAMIEQDELIEHAGYVNKRYGTPRAFVEEQLALGRDVLLEIEVQGALKVKAQYPETLMIFVTAPSIAEIRRRLLGRGTETPEAIEERIAQSEREIKEVPKYDYLLVNEEVDESVELIHQIISSERHKVYRHLDLLEELEKEIHGGKQ